MSTLIICRDCGREMGYYEDEYGYQEVEEGPCPKCRAASRASEAAFAQYEKRQAESGGES